MIRKMALLFALTVTLTAFLLSVAVSGVHADGCFVWRRGADLNEPSQKAILHWHDGIETLVLQVKYEGKADDFAWIVPLPAKPEMAAIESEKTPFEEISLYTQRRGRWGFRGKYTDEAVQSKGVKVLERKVVGVYDMAVLAAEDPKALSQWLNDHGYAFPAERKDVLEYYTKKKWVYVAMRIDRKALGSNEVKKLQVGELQPVRFTFAAQEMVYPLKISSVNAGKTQLLLYVLADVPMQVKEAPNKERFQMAVNLPRQLDLNYMDVAHGTFRKATADELPLTWEALGLPLDATWSLCRFDAVHQSKEMTGDVIFAPFDAASYWRSKLKAGNDVYSVLHARAILATSDRKMLLSLLEDDSVHAKRLAATVMPKDAPREWFDRLAKAKDKSILACLARNANTPPELLATLAKNTWDGMRAPIARNPGTPGDVLAVLATDERTYVREHVARNPNITEALLNRLAEDPAQTVRALVAQHHRTPVALLKKLGYDKEYAVRASVLRNPKIPVPLLFAFARDKNEQGRAIVGGTVKNGHVLETLARDPSAVVRAAVARNSASSSKILTTLAADKEATVRSGVAWNPRTPLSVVLLLASDEDESVLQSLLARRQDWTEESLLAMADSKHAIARSFAASSPKIPLDRLRKLATDKHLVVRGAAVRNPRLPADVIPQIATDEDWTIRRHCVSLSKTPTSVIKLLAKDKNADVRFTVAARTQTPPETLLEMTGDSEKSVRFALARNRALPLAGMMKLARDGDESVRRALAYNPATPAEVLDVLAGRHDDFYVKGGVIGHRNTRLDTLRKLADDRESEVRRVLAASPRATEGILRKLADDRVFEVRYNVAKHHKTPMEALALLAGDKASAVRCAVALHPKTPVDVLVKLAKDQNYDVQKAVAKNHTTPEHVLQTLAKKDSDFAKIVGRNLWQKHLQEASRFGRKHESPPARRTDLRFDEKRSIVWQEETPKVPIRLRYYRCIGMATKPITEIASAPGTVVVEYDLQKKRYTIPESVAKVELKK